VTPCNHVSPRVQPASAQRKFPPSSTIFRGSDRRIYRWRMTNGAIVVCSFAFFFLLSLAICVVQLAADGASSAPVAIAYDDAQSSSTVDAIGASVVLCIQPTGFHFVHEVVTTFILVEQLCRKTRVEYGLKTRVASSPCQGPIIAIICLCNEKCSRACPGTRSLSGELPIQPTKDSHWA